MKRRRFLYNTTVIATGAAGLGAGAWWVRDATCQMGVLVGCQSDYLSPIESQLTKYAAVNDNRLPPAAEMLSVARGDQNYSLWCRQVRLPYQWDFRLAGAQLANIDGRAIAWCPPGGHGPYVAAIVVSNGELHTKCVSVTELRQLVGEYLGE